jgi:hypothetical protein
MLPYWLVMEIENLLGWEHTLQINNQLIKHNAKSLYIIWIISLCSILDSLINNEMGVADSLLGM